MRPVSLFAIAGIAMIGGLVLSYAGTQAAIAGVETDAGVLGEGELLTVAANLDPEVSKKGAYAVSGPEGSLDVAVRVVGPGGPVSIPDANARHSGEGSVEGRFEVRASGVHEIVVENLGPGGTGVIAGIGYAPGDEVLVYASAGTYVIVGGMAALVGSVVMYGVNRYRAS